MTDSRRRVTPPGNPPGLWDDAIGRLPRLDIEDLAAALGCGHRAHLLLVAAHPDDETLGAGRLIASWARQIGPVSAMTMTAGEACVSQIGVEVPGIADRRRTEWAQALAKLDVQDGGVLDLPDGGLPARQPAVIERIADAARQTAPDVIIGTAANDPHGDHAAVGRAVRVVAGHLGLPRATFPIWMKYWMAPEDMGNAAEDELVVIDCGADAEARREEAWSAYRSQSTPLREDLMEVVPADLVALLTEQLLFMPSR